MTLNTLKIGDLIVRQKGPFSTHYLVYVGIHNGVKMVAENQVGSGVRYATLEEALAGNIIKRFEAFGGKEHERCMVIPRIEQMLGTAYDLVAFNCEHFARFISNGKIESRQVKTVSNLFILAGSAMMLFKNRFVRAFGLFLIVLGGIGHLSQLFKH